MTQYLVTIHRPIGYDAAVSEDEAMRREIDQLNDDMVAAGVRVFVGGLRPPGEARAIIADGSGGAVVRDGPYLKVDEFVGGLWVLETATLDEAVEWGRRASAACRAPVEVRPFYG